MNMRTHILIAALAIIPFGQGLAQPCNLTENRTDASGQILRATEYTLGSAYGTSLTLLLNRTGDRYTFLLSLTQEGNNAIRMEVDADRHPIIFTLQNGVTAKAWVSKRGVSTSADAAASVRFDEEYTVLTESMELLASSPITAIQVKCSGRDLATGNVRSEVRFPLSVAEGKELSHQFSCLSEGEAAPQQLKVVSAPPRENPTASRSAPSPKPTVAGNSAQMDEVIALLREISTGTKGVQEKVAESGSSQLEQNFLMFEKLEQLTAAIEGLKDAGSPIGTSEESTMIPRTFGFGVYFKTNYLFNNLFTMEDMSGVPEKFVAGASLNMSINMGMGNNVGFRLEPYADLMFGNTSEQDNDETFRSRSSMQQIEAGIRALLVVRRGRVNIYPGITAGYVNIGAMQIGESLDFESFNRSRFVRHGGSVGLVLGGEYLLTPHFGVRVESGMLYYIMGNVTQVNESNFGGNTQTETETTIITNGVFGTFGRIGGSFYF